MQSEMMRDSVPLLAEYLAQMAHGNADEVMIGAGEGLDLIAEVLSADKIVASIVLAAEVALRNAVIRVCDHR